MILTEFPHTLGYKPVGEGRTGVNSQREGRGPGQYSCDRREWCLRGLYVVSTNRRGTRIQWGGSCAEYVLTYVGAAVLTPMSSLPRDGRFSGVLRETAQEAGLDADEAITAA